MANWWRIHAVLSGACGSGYLVWLYVLQESTSTRLSLRMTLKRSGVGGEVKGTDDDYNDGHCVLAYGTDRGSIHYQQQ
jgi:hypothetical protein